MGVNVVLLIQAASCTSEQEEFSEHRFVSRKKWPMVYYQYRLWHTPVSRESRPMMYCQYRLWHSPVSWKSRPILYYQYRLWHAPVSRKSRPMTQNRGRFSMSFRWALSERKIHNCCKKYNCCDTSLEFADR